jgi:hypothetical protein
MCIYWQLIKYLQLFILQSKARIYGPVLCAARRPHHSSPGDASVYFGPRLEYISATQMRLGYLDLRRLVEATGYSLPLLGTWLLHFPSSEGQKPSQVRFKESIF